MVGTPLCRHLFHAGYLDALQRPPGGKLRCVGGGAAPILPDCSLARTLYSLLQVANGVDGCAGSWPRGAPPVVAATGERVETRIAEAVARIRAEIAEAATRVGRSPSEITLVAVTKTRTHDEVDAALAGGVAVLGENRVQEAAEKLPLVHRPAQWHLIGHLQTNKARQAARLFDMVQSVDSARLAGKLDESAGSGRRLDVLIEVNTSGEESKFGIRPGESSGLVDAILGMANLRLRGFMTVGALSTDERQVRTGFQILREIAEGARREHPAAELDVLSMGMTSDFRWAISEGSTMVRIGTAIFGERGVLNNAGEAHV